MSAPTEPLKIGPIPVDPPVVLAPMAGVTNSAFRTLCRSYGAGLYVSEMVSARALVEGSERTRKMLAFSPDEEVRSIQLYVVDPPVVGRAVDILLDHGADHIDLNMGCPVPKVTKLGGGAALPMHRVLFTDLVRAAVTTAGDVPVTVKMRIGVDEDAITYLDAGRIAAGEGVAAVAEDAGHRLKVAEAMASPVQGDPELLFQLLANLVENAIVHTSPGTTITVSLRHEAERAVLIVEDDGPGIPPGAQEKIFRRFYRLDASRSTSGHGLGLALVVAVAELHGGDAVATPSGARGLRIVVSLPR